MRGALFLAVAALVAACRSSDLPRLPLPPEPPSRKEGDLAKDLAQDARQILDVHCGTCHREDSPDALPGALAVFNLNHDDWYAGLPEARLENAAGRIRGLVGQDPAAARAFGGPVTSTEEARFRRFVDAELARREE